MARSGEIAQISRVVARIRNYQNRSCEKSAARQLPDGLQKTSRRAGFVRTARKP
jgi:hypothetical protein